MKSNMQIINLNAIKLADLAISHFNGVFELLSKKKHLLVADHRYEALDN